MGVPKFYRWISERYPKINQIVSDHALLPEFDHLYLDMNGIIHGCTHPHDRDLSDGLSERDMMLGIMHYLERIVTIVKPKVSLYMAIDGVAPRAKLNQQRSRRFRSAKDMAESMKDLDEETKQDVFDSNCITPGTEFLTKVSKVIQYFIRKKMKEDSLWKHLQVIFSGHDIPGEGEHKIMNYIRQMRNQPNYQPNTRHCMYGQDADLIMLGLVTHEPHFTLLREVVDFNMNRNNNNKNSLKAVKKFTKQSDFQLLHLSVLREYLSFEFVEQQQQQPALYDLERCIDDFVFLTFTLGCDFLPHGVLDIGENAFDLLFGLYKEQRRGWGQGQYLVLAGEIVDPLRLEHLLTAIGACENEILSNREETEKEYTKKRRRWDKRDGKAPGPSDQEIQVAEAVKEQDYSSMMSSVLEGNNNPDDFIEGWAVGASSGEKDFKGRYYHEKLHFKPTDKQKHWELCKSYIEGLQWCLAYYYRGCISWGWFYPYHYSPMMSDLKHLPRMFSEIKFELGAPVTPFQQLMACLPPASAKLVPKLYRGLMTSPQSPIIHFYPLDFEIDANGKRNPWESLNLLPFIEIDLLKSTIVQQCPPEKLAPGEEGRNKIGKVMLYRHDPTNMETAASPNRDIGLPDLIKCCSSVQYFDEDLGLSPYIFEPRLIPETQIPFPGYPSLGVLPMQNVIVEPIGLNCFGNPSKYATMMLTMFEMPQLPPMEELAKSVLDRSVYVNWPMMHEAKIAAVSDGYQEFRMVKGKPKAKQLSNAASSKWLAETEIMSQMYCSGSGMPGSGGVRIGEITVRLKVLPLQGMKTNPANGSKKKCYGGEEADVPLQLCLWQAPAPDPRLIECGPATLEDRFPIDSRVVLTKGKHRGCLGTVVSIVDTKSIGVHVQTMPPENQFGLAIARSVQEYYVSSVDAARILKLHPSVIGKIMGRMQFVQGNYDLGLNLKTSDGNCVVGYTRKRVDESERKSKGSKKAAWDAGDSVLVVGSRLEAIDGDDDDARLQWEYSPKAIRAVQEYQQNFPSLFSGLKKVPNERKYDAKAVMGPKGEELLPVIREWLDKHESAKIPRSPVSSDLLPAEATKAIEKAASVRLLATTKKGFPKKAMLKVPGSALYLEASTGATDVILASDLNENSYPVLGDRVVNICSDGVPFGARGTVVGIHEAATTGSVEVVMDEEFVGGTTLQGHCSNFHGKLCLWSQVLKIAVGGDTEERPAASKVVSQKAVTKLLKKTEGSLPNEPQASTPPRHKSNQRSQHTTPSRANSAGHGRQGAWREARGPPEKGNGFKRNKKTSSGLERWKQQRHVVAASLDLKAKLGISTPQAQLPVEDPAATQLKALLGVKPKTKDAGSQRKAKKQQLAASATSTPEPVTILQRGQATQSLPKISQDVPPAAATPADKLLHLLTTKKQTIPTVPEPFSSPFNFTYTEVGPTTPQPAAPPVPVVPHFVPPPPPHPATWSSPSPSATEYPPLGGNIALATGAKKSSPAAVLVPSAVTSGKTSSLQK